MGSEVNLGPVQAALNANPKYQQLLAAFNAAGPQQKPLAWAALSDWTTNNPASPASGTNFANTGGAQDYYQTVGGSGTLTQDRSNDPWTSPGTWGPIIVGGAAAGVGLVGAAGAGASAAGSAGAGVQSGLLGATAETAADVAGAGAGAGAAAGGAGAAAGGSAAATGGGWGSALLGGGAKGTLATSALGTGAQVYGSKEQADAAANANKTQQQANTNALTLAQQQQAQQYQEFQQQQTALQNQWNAQQAIRAPYRAAGVAALGNIGKILGTNFS